VIKITYEMKRCKSLASAIFLVISFWCYISLSSTDVLSEPDSKLAKKSEVLVEIEVREEKAETTESPNPASLNEQNLLDEKGKEKVNKLFFDSYQIKDFFRKRQWTG
jgi:hypothetical protein